jgi:hypothetical protein
MSVEFQFVMELLLLLTFMLEFQFAMELLLLLTFMVEFLVMFHVVVEAAIIMVAGGQELGIGVLWVGVIGAAAGISCGAP